MKQLALIMLIPLLMAPLVYATPYESGYHHGCCDKNYSYDYSKHTKEFNQGYVDGFNSSDQSGWESK